ncbi:sulfotransferase family protein [Marinicaulis aureus]|uniref:Sulfotransferase family protein n=1 Tax=Hyphococcus aureus TaxID=2666033 RepID=A0ABW1KX24_9PROT
MSLQLDAIIAAARTQTGLSDFGPWDPFLQAMDVFIKSANKDGALSENGEYGVQQQLTAGAAAFLLAVNYRKLFPQAFEQPVEKPVFILGLPRSGTTKLQRMVAASPDLNFLPTWQCLFPVPFSGDKTVHDDQRFEAAAIAADQMNSAAADLKTVHVFEPEEAEEESALLQHTCLTRTWSYYIHAPDFVSWLNTADITPAYDFLRDCLQILQWQDNKTGKPWVLKAVIHTENLTMLTRTFPDASLVWCHRDPVEAVPSWCSLIAQIRGLFSEDIDAKKLGAEQQQVLADMILPGVEWRRQNPERRILDLSYQRTVKEGESVIRELHEFAGWTLSDKALTAMLAWESANQKDKHGRHRYSLEQYGLDEAGVRTAFAEYIAAYIQ